MTEVFWMDEHFGTIVDPAKLTKKQLLEAIENYDRCVIREPGGSFNMIDCESSEYNIYEGSMEEATRQFEEERRDEANTDNPFQRAADEMGW
jgi:hypothetical protein